MSDFDQQKYQRDSATVEQGLWPKLRRAASSIPFAEDAIAAYYCMRDPLTPRYVKAMLAGALAYFVMPFDLIPDFIAGFGYTDDAAVLFAAFRAISKHIQPDHRQRAKSALEALRDGKDVTPASQG